MGKRGAACTVCESDKRHSVELGLVHRVPARVLSARFSLSKDAILRHARNHLTPVQRAALLAHAKPQPIDLDALRTTEGEGLLAQLVAQRARLQLHSETAATLGDARGAVAAENAITANLALVGKLLGMLATQHHVTHTNLLISPDYLRLRQTLVDALRPFPEAARAVSAALALMESEAATDITAKASRARRAVIEHEPRPTAALPPPPC